MVDEPTDEPPDYPRLTAMLGEGAVSELQTLVVDVIREQEDSGDIAADPSTQIDAPPEPTSED